MADIIFLIMLIAAAIAAAYLIIHDENGGIP